MNNKKQSFLLRCLIYFLGINLLAFGIILNTRAGMGVGAINSFPYAMSQITALTLGTWTTILYVGYTIAQLAIARKPDGKVLLQIPFSFLMGYVIDFYDRLMDFRAAGLPAALLLVFAAVVVTALGAYLMVTMDFIPNPADGMARSVGLLLHKDLGQGKLVLDAVMVSFTALISLVLARRIIGIGLGTVVSALGVGPAIRVYSRLLGDRLRKIVEKSR